MSGICLLSEKCFVFEFSLMHTLHSMHIQHGFFTSTPPCIPYIPYISCIVFPFVLYFVLHLINKIYT
jgi:hypothetical protein